MKCPAAPRTSPALAALVAAAFASRPATSVAREVEAAFVGEALVGYTDNAQSSPDNPVPGVPEKRGDELAVVSPGLELSHASPGARQRLGVLTSVTFYWHETDADTWSNRVEYQGLFDVERRTSLLFGANATATRAWSAVALTPAGAGQLATTVQGAGTFLTLTLDELLSHDFSPSVRGWQGARFSYGTPLDDETAPYSTDSALRFGLERSFRIDALGAELREEHASVSAGPGRAGIHQLTSTGVAIHRHDFGLLLTSRLEAGAMRVDRLRSGRAFWHPSALAALAYTNEWGQAELAYSHRATTDVQLGQTLLVDEVSLVGGVPLIGERTLVAGGSAAYQRGRVIEEDATRGARLDVLLADVGLAWRAAPAVALGVRYQHTRQISDATAPPQPLSFRRNTLLIGATIRLPPETEPRRPLREPKRVDRGDDVRAPRSRGEQRRVD